MQNSHDMDVQATKTPSILPSNSSFDGVLLQGTGHVAHETGAGSGFVTWLRHNAKCTANLLKLLKLASAVDMTLCSLLNHMMHTFPVSMLPFSEKQNRKLKTFTVRDALKLRHGTFWNQLIF